MFTIAQHIGIMKTTKNTFRYLISVMIIVVLGACSSTNNLPVDDVYYSSKLKTQLNIIGMIIRKMPKAIRIIMLIKTIIPMDLIQNIQ